MRIFTDSYGEAVIVYKDGIACFWEHLSSARTEPRDMLTSFLLARESSELT